MSSRRTKHSRTEIALLPEELLVEILCHLPSKDVVATSILSKSWRHLWKEVTTFDVEAKNITTHSRFVECFNTVLPVLKVGSMLKYRIMWTRACQLEEDVFSDAILRISLMVKALRVLDLSSDQFAKLPDEIYTCKTLEIMRLHRSFMVELPDVVWLPKLAELGIIKVGYATSETISNLICGCPVLRVLDLSLDQFTKLPDVIYTCKTLDILRLDGSFMAELSDVVLLPKLAELWLNEFRYASTKTVSSLVRACPVLQSLVIKRRGFTDIYENFTDTDEDLVLTISSLSLKRLQICYTYPKWRDEVISYRHRKLSIDAPAAEHLVLHDSVSNNISIHGCSSVNEVDLDIDDNLSPSDVVGILEKFQRARFLKLSENLMTALQITTRTLSSASFDRLARLSLRCFHDSQSYILVELMDRCLNLQVLEVTSCGTNEISGEPPYRGIPRCLPSSLKRVTFRQFTEFDVIKLVLNHGSVMETCDLWFDPTTYRKRSEIVKKVSVMRKASPTCEISLTFGDSEVPDYIG